MAIAPLDSSHPSNPVFQTDAAVSVAAAAINHSAIVDCEGFATAMVCVDCTQPHAVRVRVSFDEVRWFILVSHHDTVGQSAYTDAAGGGGQSARRVELGGARFVRVSVTNNGATAATLSTSIALQG